MNDNVPNRQTESNDYVTRDDYAVSYIDSAGDEHMYPGPGQGPGKLADEDDLARDELGFTNPNLHRRIDPKDPPTAEDPLNQEVSPRSYQLNIQGLRSYRTTTINVHDEESVDSEIP